MRYVTILLLSMTLYSCKSLDVFRNEVRTEFNLSDEELYYVQYFIGGGLELEYVNIESENRIGSDNEVNRSITKYEKSIAIEDETPGILVEVDEDLLTVSISQDLNLGFLPTNYSPNSTYYLDSINGTVVENRTQININGDNYIVRFGHFSKKAIGKNRLNLIETGKTPILLYQFTERLKEVRDQQRVRGRTLD